MYLHHINQPSGKYSQCREIRQTAPEEPGDQVEGVGLFQFFHREAGGREGPFCPRIPQRQKVRIDGPQFRERAGDFRVVGQRDLEVVVPLLLFVKVLRRDFGIGPGKAPHVPHRGEWVCVEPYIAFGTEVHDGDALLVVRLGEGILEGRPAVADRLPSRFLGAM